MPDIRYRFIEEGAEKVERSFSTIARSAKESAKAGRERAAVERSYQPRARQQDAHVKARVAHEKEVARQVKLADRAREQSHRAELQRFHQRQREEQRAITRQRQAMFAQRQHLSRQSAAAVGAIAGTMASKGYDAVSGYGGAAVRQALDNQGKAKALSVAGRQAGQAGVDPEQLLQDAQRTARAIKGTKVADILDAQAKFVAMTGDLTTARGLGETFANASAATGAKAEDIAAMTATMSTKFGITDPEEMKKAVADAIFQGKAGAFEMRDAAQYFQEMGAAGARFGLGQGANGVRTLGGLAQLARGSTGSGAEAATAVQAMFSDLLEKSNVIDKVSGAKVFTDKTNTKTRAIDDVLVDILKGTKGDKAKLGSIFGERGMRGASALIEAFNKGADAAGKNATEAERMAAGEKAMRELFNSTVKAGGDWSEVLKDAATMTSGASASMDSLWEELVNTIGTALTPGLESLANNASALAAIFEPLAMSVGDAVDTLGQFVQFLQDKGLISKGAGGASANPGAEYGTTTARLGELDTLSKTTGLTAAQRSEQRKLRDRRVELSQQLNDEMKKNPGLYAGTGGVGADEMGAIAANMAANGPAAEPAKPSLAPQAEDFRQGALGVFSKNNREGWAAAMGVQAASSFGALGTAASIATQPKIETDSANKSVNRLGAAAEKAASVLEKISSVPGMPGLPSVLGL
jgi:TP901 family phage tail tape measure protein